MWRGLTQLRNGFFGWSPGGLCRCCCREAGILKHPRFGGGRQTAYNCCTWYSMHSKETKQCSQGLSPRSYPLTAQAQAPTAWTSRPSEALLRNAFNATVCPKRLMAPNSVPGRGEIWIRAKSGLMSLLVKLVDSKSLDSRSRKIPSRQSSVNLPPIRFNERTLL